MREIACSAEAKNVIAVQYHFADRDGVHSLLDAAESEAARYDSMQRWRNMLQPVLDPDAAALHRRFAVLVYSAVELARRAESSPHTDDRLFTSLLVDMVTALWSAPVSEETRQLARVRTLGR